MTAAAAIAANATGTQAAEGRARHAASVADASGGGAFSAFLAQLFQTAQAGPETPTSEQSALTAEQSAQSALQTKGAQPSCAANNTALPTDASAAPQTTTPASILAQAKNSALAKLTQPAAGEISTAASANLSAQMPPWLAALTAHANQQAQSPLNTQSTAQQAQNPGVNGVGAPDSAPPSVPGTAVPTFPAIPPTQAGSTPVGAPTPTTTGANPVAQNATASAIASALMQTFANTPSANAAANPAQSPASPAVPAPASQATATSLPSTLSKTAATPASTGPLAGPASQITDAERQIFVQASHNALRQGATTPVTEAKTLPLNLDSGGDNSASPSPQAAGTNHILVSDPQSPQPPTGATVDPILAGTAQPVLTHDANALQQTAAQANATDTSAANAPTSAIASAGQASMPANNFALQVGPATTTTDSSLQPNVQAIAVSIAAQAQPGSKQFNIRLDPPELGRVDVRLIVDSAGKAQAHLAVDKPQTLEFLQRDSGTLARALKDSGVQLNNNGLQFSLKGQDRQSAGPQPKSRSLAVTAVQTAAPAAGLSSTSNIFASGSGVDIRV